MKKTCDTHLVTIESQGEGNPSVKRILEDTRINKDLLYKGMTCSSCFGIN